MPRNLKRYSGAGDLHFITCSCYHRRQYLASARRRDLFLTILEQVRQRYGFVVLGYVVMPEHFHLLISEPEKGYAVHSDASAQAAFLQESPAAVAPSFPATDALDSGQ